MSLLSFYILPTNICIFSKSTCGYCNKAIQFLSEYYNVECQVVEIDKISYGRDIAYELQTITRQTTVPNIFLYGKHIGGYTELVTLHKNGMLQSLIRRNTIQLKYVCDYCGSEADTNKLTCGCVHRAFSDWGSPM